MKDFFVGIHINISKRKFLFTTILMLLIIVSVFLLLNINFKEDADAIMPKDARIDEISEAFRKSGLADKIIINFSLLDYDIKNTDLLISAADKFVEKISKDSGYINGIDYKVDESEFLFVYDFIYRNLPLFMDDNDYSIIETFINEQVIEEKIKSGYMSLISPASIITGRYFFKDPLNIVPLSLKKIQDFKIDENFIIYNSCVFTKDKKHLLVFIDPYYSSGNTRENAILVNSINDAVLELSNVFPNVNIEYYGGTVVAIENAARIKKDILLTVSVSFVFLSMVFWLFFRRLRLIVFLFAPIFMGAILSLTILSLIAGEVSLISLGVGAILLCIAIDYSLHLVTHNRKYGVITETIKKVSSPVIISSVTTASALLCIYVLKSEALKQLSLFAALGIIITAIAALVILPFLIKNIKFNTKARSSEFYEKIINIDFHKKTFLIMIILGLSIFFPFTIKNLKFNSDIAALNYQSANVSKAEKNLRKISAEANSGVFVFTHANTLDKALLKTENNLDIIKSHVDKGNVKSFSSATDLIMSTNAQQEKINKWNEFWTENNKQYVTSKISEIGANYNFQDYAFNEFFEVLNKEYKPLEPNDFDVIINSFLSNYVSVSDDDYYVTSILKVDNENKTELLESLILNKDLIIYDNQLFINQLLEILKEDFNKLSVISLIVVFGLLLFFFGRIEIAIITFIPIVIGWIWTLGLMSILGIEFNVFNIIVLSFIFGLGLDYSIFLISGLIEDYKHGNTPLITYKLSVFLSAITTIGGFGVLILAKHPALKSIAFVSIIGILSILIISFTLTPLLFNALINIKNKRRKEPINFINSLISVVSLFVFVAGSFIITFFVPLIYVTPLKRKHKKMFIAFLINRFSRFVVNINYTIKREYIDKHKIDFSKPSVIISNHQSHLDLVLILMLHPKIIVFTNKWVWNNIFYGFIIRYAEYFPAYKGIEEGFDLIKRKVEEGYSILIFPEGKRTIDGEINRFHQGALNVANELNMEVQPIMIHGAYDCLPKNEFFLKSGKITIKFFDEIKPEPVETGHGITFKQQAKNITAFYREEYKKLKELKETPDYYKRKLINQYIYKSPVLEWYLKIKLKLEKNYKFFNDIIPHKAKIVDIGCGYGFLAYMLRFISKDRIILGIDYDEEKISVADNLSVKDNGTEFKVSDVTKEKIPEADVYILNDVLHYMPENEQINLINNCIDNINDNGMIIIRDADMDMKRRTMITKLTEIMSTKIFKFNKTKHKLTFVSRLLIKKLAHEKALNCEIYDNSILTSNITYVIKK